MDSWLERARAWWPVAAVFVGVVGFVALFVQQSAVIRTNRELTESITAMHGRLVALEETTSQLRLDQVGAQMRAGAARVPRPRPMPDADGKAGGTKAKAKAGKAKAGKAKAEGAAKVGKAKAKRGKAKAKAKAAP